MCAVCRKNPCDSRCPNAEEPKSIYTCEWCEEPIYEGDKYMDTPEGPVCKDCIEGMSATEFCELMENHSNSREGGRIEWKIRQECSRQHHKRHRLFR